MPEDRPLEYADLLAGTECLNQVVLYEHRPCLRLFDDYMIQ
jgi:hypothetical protein